MELKKEFESNIERVKTLPKRPNNEELLQLYAFFKQATQGDVTGEKPSRLNFTGRAKWEAWETKKGMNSETAMKEYNSYVNLLFQKY